MAGNFEVLFRGEIYASVDPVQARTDMARLFRQPPERVMRLFDGRSWVLKDGLDRETAERYQVELAKIGVISELRDTAPQIREKQDSPHGKSQNFTLESVAIVRMSCPACGYEQLEADYCARCGVNVAAARSQQRQRQKEDEIIQRRIRSLRGGAPAERAKVAPTPAAPAAAAPAEPTPEVPPGLGRWLVAGAVAAVVVVAVSVVLVV